MLTPCSHTVLSLVTNKVYIKEHNHEKNTQPVLFGEHGCTLPVLSLECLRLIKKEKIMA